MSSLCESRNTQYDPVYCRQDLANLADFVLDAVEIGHEHAGADLDRVGQELDAVVEQVPVGAPEILDDKADVGQAIVALLAVGPRLAALG